MKNIIRTLLIALALATISWTSVSAQSANRTMVGVPVVPQQSKTAIVEIKEVRECRLHCGALAATPNMKAVAPLPVQQARAEACAHKMIRNR